MATLVRIAGATGLVLTLAALFITIWFDVGSALGPVAAVGFVTTLGAMVLGLVQEFTEIQEARPRAEAPIDPDICQECGYDLARLPSDRCPECGTQRPEGTYTLTEVY